MDAVHTHVFIVDCIWEYFVLVGPDARGNRREIRLALQTATVCPFSTSFTVNLAAYCDGVQEMSAIVAPSRPYAPTVHALVLPSQLPIDLRLTFRDMDEVNLVSQICSLSIRTSNIGLE